MNIRPTHTGNEIIKSPLLEKLGDLAENITGMGFSVVFPVDGGWCCSHPGKRADLPEFCRLVQGTEKGAQRCRMCHILMSIAGCRKGTFQQRCHAGASVLIAPVSKGLNESHAVIGTCTFTSEKHGRSISEARKTGRRLGIDPDRLERAYRKLPAPDRQTMQRARFILEAAAYAVSELRTKPSAGAQNKDPESSADTGSDIDGLVKTMLQSPAGASGYPGRPVTNEKSEKLPVLIQLVAEMISTKPEAPYTVSEVSAAARITPSYFSTLFRKSTGRTFKEFLNEQRISMAKELLLDRTLNVGEIAYTAGYNDPSYFTRCFRKMTGMTPTEWRDSR